MAATQDLAFPGEKWPPDEPIPSELPGPNACEAVRFTSGLGPM